MTKQLKFIIYFCAFLYFLPAFCKANYSKIKLYAFYTPSHKILKDRYFLPSIKDDYKVIIKKIKDQVNPSGKFHTHNWYKAVANKADLIMQAIKDNWGKFFIYSDVDIQFIRPTKPFILKNFKNLDVLGQANKKSSNSKTMCTGFMVIRANQKMYDLWKEVKALLLKYKKKGDQYYFNKLLQKYHVKYKLLPNSFYLPGRYWKPGHYLNIPRDIMIHHANWTKGIENKIKQLEYVKYLTRNTRY